MFGKASANLPSAFLILGRGFVTLARPSVILGNAGKSLIRDCFKRLVNEQRQGKACIMLGSDFAKDAGVGVNTPRSRKKQNTQKRKNKKYGNQNLGILPQH
ncbi:MAG: hypothetical protein ACTHKU_12105 [Verrucomicrobiota bacterium]